MSPPDAERRPQQEAAPTVIPADDITTMVAPAGDNLPDQTPAYKYGRAPGDESWARRQFIHWHITTQRTVAHALPTNVRAIYYVGKAAGAWDGDHAGRGRKPSQNVSDAAQWLIDQGLVDDSEIIDANGHLDASLGVVDLLTYIRRQAARVKLDPWAPRDVPVLLAEGRNDLALVQPIGTERSVRWVALGGMAGRGHLRRVADTIDPSAPIGYVGDWNRSGRDIERNAEGFLRDRGWLGNWTRLLVTEDQIEDHDLPPRVSVDGRDGRSDLSVESAAMPVGAARQEINHWLDGHLPDEPTADDSQRAEIVAALEALAGGGDRG